MVLNAWNFLQGYVAVEVTGASVERFLNMAAHRGIYIWDVSPVPGGAKIHCSLRGFRLLDDCAEKTKSSLKVVRSEGLPVIMQRYRRRKILLGGVAFFMVFLYVLSSFVWHIEIQGNERVAAEDILEFINERGLHVGAFKSFIDHRELTQQLLFEFSDISWADVHTQGTRSTIIIAETIPEQARISRDTPCNIIAARDGLITSIVTAAGMPKVRQNDIVRQGDILVSGVLPLVDSEEVILVHSYAEVWAKMYSQLTFSIPMTYSYKIFTGNEERHHSLRLLLFEMENLNLFHGRISFMNYDRIVSYIQPGAAGNYPLPLIWTTVTYREFVPEERQRSVEGAKALAERIVTERIIREFDFHADIIGKQIEFTELPDKLMVKALITTNQRIDKAVPIE